MAAEAKVRGITIELGADTTGISKALGGLNKEIGSTTKQLKDVERLLKLDPSNTELQAQKQELLNKAINKSEEKVKALDLQRSQSQKKSRQRHAPSHPARSAVAW